MAFGYGRVARRRDFIFKGSVHLDGAFFFLHVYVFSCFTKPKYHIIQAQMSDNKPITTEEAQDIIRALGLVFTNSTLYSPSHSVTKQALDQCYAIISTVLQNSGELQIAISDENLMLNGEMVDLANPLMKMVVTNLAALEIGSFSITKEISEEKFHQLIDVLNSKPEDLKQFGGFGEAIKSFDLSSVKATKITVLQVTEHEEVVSKGDKAVDIEAAANDIAAFLKSEAQSPEEIEGLAVQLKTVASNDSDKLSELIIQSASEAKAPSTDPEDDSYCDEVINSIKRVYEAISSDPSFNSQKGKKALKKALKALEESIVARLKDEGAYFSDDDMAAISDSFEQINDEIEIDGLASDYMKKRTAIESNESRILRFIRTKGMDKIGDSDLEERMKDGGLSFDGWQELLFKSGIGDDLVGDGATGMAAVGHLAMLLDQMESSADLVDGAATPDGVKKEDVAHIMGDVDKEVQKMVLRAEKKIRDLVQQVKESDEEPDAKGKASGTKKPGLSKKKLLVQLAEVVQELCQPLSVINCSIEMILTGTMGEVSPSQSDMLSLAEESTKKVQTLIDHLLELSGVPKTLKPDRKIQDSIYEEDAGGEKGA
jgi:hypothetical protein